ncbi:hypothetical protein CRYUN_Cryun04dG0123500 [Craigia yunnanensis]
MYLARTRDVQAAAARAAHMEKFGSPSSLTTSTSTLSSSSSLSFLVSHMDLSSGSNELSEIVELPSLEQVMIRLS